MIENILEKICAETQTIIVDFHATTTAEKYTMFYHLDGKVAAVLGSHTKVLSADARVLPGGTAIIAGTGRTGSRYSVGGLEPEIEISKFLTQIHEQSRVTWKDLELQGILIETNDDGKAVSIEIVREVCEEADHDRTGYS
jgi:calcineurin-like phosphoesterase